MAAVQFNLPYDIAIRPTNTGVPGANLFVFAPGTTTKREVYSTDELTTQLSNPVIADGAGRFPAIYLDNALTYKIVITDKGADLGSPLYTKDPYIPGQAPDSSALQPYQDAAAASASAASTSAGASAASAASAETSATNAAVSEGNASTSAATASTGAQSVAAMMAAVLAALAGTTISSITMAASDRTALAVLSPGLPARLTEHPRQSIRYHFTSSEYNLAFGRALADDMASDDGSIFTATATGAWVFPYWSEDVSDSLFGAVDAADVKAPVEAWSKAVWGLPCKSASCHVAGVSALPLTVGTTGSCQTKNVRFGPKINATAAMDVLVTVQNEPGGMDYSGLSLWGSAATSTGQAWASRLAGYGLRRTNAQYATSKGQIFCANFKYWGDLINDSAGPNSNYAQAPQLHAHSCGISKSAGGTSAMSSNWSSPVRHGGPGSIAQTTTLNVVTVPDTDPIKGTSGWVYWIGGQPYSISAVAASGDPTYPNALTLRGWLDDASMTAGSGTGDYTVGGARLFAGSDTNVIDAGSVFAVNCGYTYLDQTLYGASARRISTDGGVDIVYGYGLASNGAHTGGGVEEVYIEGNSCLAQVLSFAPTASSGVKIGKFTGAGINFAKWFKLGPRATGVAQLYYQQMSEIISLAGYEGQAIIAQNGPVYTATYDPPSIADKSSASTTITVGAALPVGSVHRVRFNKNLSGMTMEARVSANDVSSATVKVVISNLTGGAVDLASGTLTLTLMAA